MIQFKGKEIDLDRVLPLTLGDFIKLEEVGVTMQSLESNSLTMKQLANMYFYILNKADPSIVFDDVAGLHFSDPIFMQIGESIKGGAEKLDPPT